MYFLQPPPLFSNFSYPLLFRARSLHVLVEALVCVPVEQHFQHVKQPWAKWAVWTCGKLLCNAVTGMRGAWICSVDENGHLNSTNLRLQKRSPQFFNKRFSSQTIKILSIVNLPFPCAIVTSLLRCHWPNLDLGWFRAWLCVIRCEIRRKYEGIIVLTTGLRPCRRWSRIRVGTVDELPGHCLPLCWKQCKADCQFVSNTKPTSCTLESNFQSRRTGEIQQNTWGWRIQPLNVLVGESKAIQTGLHCPPPYLEKRKCVGTSQMRRGATWMHRGKSINNCPTGSSGAVPYAKQQESRSWR